MKLAIFDIIPRVQRMLSHPELVRSNLLISIGVGFIEGVSLFLLIPAITALADGGTSWGLGIAGWSVVLLILALIGGVAGYIQSQRSYGTALDMVGTIHRRIGEQVARLPLGWFAQPIAGRLSRLVSTELLMAGEVIAHFLYPMVSRITASVVLLVCAWLWDWRLGLMLTISTPIFLVFVLVAAAIGHKGNAIAGPAERQLSDRIVEFTQCQAALRSCGRSADYAELKQANSTWLSAKRKELWFEIGGQLIGGAFVQVVVVSFIVLAAQLATTGTLSVIATIGFIGISLRYAQMLTGITESAMGIETRRVTLDALDEILTAERLPEPEVSTVGDSPGTISFEDVSFGYRSDKPVVRNLSFEVPQHSMVALVGPSGCGKTTIARLASRFYEVDAGSVRIGGVDVREQTTHDLMKQLSMVFQDVYLFDDTLIENIRIGRPGATEDDIREAARLAGVIDIVNRLPNGWDTPVGEGGRALSGGERQRVAIARALLKQAPIVLFDEATSALDPENEANIVAAIEKLRQTATILVIAHKLDTIRKADTIIQLTADGTVEDMGTHEQLLERGGTYRDFWDQRAKAQGWQLT